ncbi:MAG: FAD-binding oxidoreductase [Nitrospirae bacterium]|nr:FAD-binding oxidoreductase [Nitrospirota bacterium]
MIVKKEKGETLNYLEDASNLKADNIESVFIPQNEEEVGEIVRECSARNIPLTVSAGGTGVVGGRVPLGGGVILSTEKLNEIVEINKEKKYAVLQAGVVISDFLEELSKQKLFYPPFPTERTAFIGGNVATNASGEYSFKFGSTREYVRGIKVVLSDGKVVWIRRGETFAQDGYLGIPSTDIKFKVPGYEMPSVRKNAAGYYSKADMDLIDIFIGSEGTLGIITEVEVKVIEEPPDVFFCAVFFQDSENAFSMVTDIEKRKDILNDILCLEYFDSNSLQLLKEFYPQVPGVAEECLLFATQVNSPESLDVWDKLLGGYNSISNWFADSPKQKEELYGFRHKLPEIINEIVRKNSYPKISTDIVVPEDKFWQMNDFYREKLKGTGMKHVIFGHIGESHLHVNLLPENEEERQEASRLYLEFSRKGVELGGTVSGEHGIGKRKHQLLKIMYGEEGLKQMARVKKSIDKSCILGLDNIFPRVLID